MTICWVRRVRYYLTIFLFNYLTNFLNALCIHSVDYVMRLGSPLHLSQTVQEPWLKMGRWGTFDR